MSTIRRNQLEMLEIRLRSHMRYLRTKIERLKLDPESGPTPDYVVETRLYRCMVTLLRVQNAIVRGCALTFKDIGATVDEMAVNLAVFDQVTATHIDAMR